MTVLLLLALMMPAPAGQAQNATVEPGSGTVNIFLANQSGLVAVADSMISYTKAVINEGEDPYTHEVGHVKIFKIDEKTIATIAGLYSFPTKAGHGFDFNTPEIFADIIDRQFSGLSLNTSLDDKAFRIFDSLKHRWTANLQAVVAGDQTVDVDGLQPVEVTIAGYDLDGSLKIAEMTLKATKTKAGIDFLTVDRPPDSSVPCESVITGRPLREEIQAQGVPPIVLTVGKSLLCAIAGIPQVADKRLSHPESFAEDSALQAYLVSENTHSAMSVAELRALAVDLAQQTANEEKETKRNFVGGEIRVAVLSDGKVSEEPTGSRSQQVSGSLLSAPQFGRMTLPCTPGTFGVLPIPGFQAAATLTNCIQPIDGMIFHDSLFTSSKVVYLGPSIVVFPMSNKLVDTELVLGPKVELERDDVRHLICDFPWKAISIGKLPYDPRCSLAKPR